MYKELALLKNFNGSWDYIFDISKTEINPILQIEDAITFLISEFDLLNHDDILVEENEIFILTTDPLPCFNCGDSK